MALSDANRAKIRRYLGYPDGNRELHSDLEGAMTSLSSEGETEVTSILTSLGTIETTLTSSWSRQKVLRAEEVTLAGEGEIRALRAEGARLVEALAATLGVCPRRNYFGGGSSSSGIAGRG